MDGIPQTVGGKPNTGLTVASGRLAWTERWTRAREWFAGTFEGVPVERTVDAAGNLWITLPGERPFLARGRIVHRTKTSEEFFGVEFTDIAREDRRRIERYVAALPVSD